MKRTVLLLLTGIMVCGLTACSGITGGTDTSKAQPAAQGETTMESGEKAGTQEEVDTDDPDYRKKQAEKEDTDDPGYRKQQAAADKEEEIEIVEDTEDDQADEEEQDSDEGSLLSVAAGYVGSTLDSLKAEIGEPDEEQITVSDEDDGDDSVCKWGSDLTVYAHAKPGEDAVILSVE